jgi:hypothetical protein
MCTFRGSKRKSTENKWRKREGAVLTLERVFKLLNTVALSKCSVSDISAAVDASDLSKPSFRHSSSVSMVFGSLPSSLIMHRCHS